MLSVLQTLDGGALLWIQENLRGLLDPIVEGYTTLGNTGLMWIVLSLAMLCWKPTRKAGVAALAAMVLGLLCTNVVLKHVVARPRPWLDVAGLVPADPGAGPQLLSLRAYLCCLCGSIRLVAALPRRWMRWTGLVLAVCMGLSRLYVGVHYPSDVIAGALVGLFCGWAAWKLLQLWEERRGSRLR